MWATRARGARKQSAERTGAIVRLLSGRFAEGEVGGVNRLLDLMREVADPPDVAWLNHDPIVDLLAPEFTARGDEEAPMGMGSHDLRAPFPW